MPKYSSAKLLTPTDGVDGPTAARLPVPRGGRMRWPLAGDRDEYRRRACTSGRRFTDLDTRSVPRPPLAVIVLPVTWLLHSAAKPTEWARVDVGALIACREAAAGQPID